MDRLLNSYDGGSQNDVEMRVVEGLKTFVEQKKVNSSVRIEHWGVERELFENVVVAVMMK